MVNFNKILILALLLMLLIVACSSEVSTPDLSVTPFPMGTYKSMEYAWVFEEGGTYFFYQLNAPDEIVNGTYTITGDQIEIQDDYCPGGEKGTYKWEFDGILLSFTTLGDPCKDRSTWNVRLPWKLEE